VAARSSIAAYAAGAEAGVADAAAASIAAYAAGPEEAGGADAAVRCAASHEAPRRGAAPSEEGRVRGPGSSPVLFHQGVHAVMLSSICTCI
jgi:hypothetical protein